MHMEDCGNLSYTLVYDTDIVTGSSTLLMLITACKANFYKAIHLHCLFFVQRFADKVAMISDLTCPSRPDFINNLSRCAAWTQLDAISTAMLDFVCQAIHTAFWPGGQRTWPRECTEHVTHFHFDGC